MARGAGYWQLTTTLAGSPPTPGMRLVVGDRLSAAHLRGDGGHRPQLPPSCIPGLEAALGAACPGALVAHRDGRHRTPCDCGWNETVRAGVRADAPHCQAGGEGQQGHGPRRWPPRSCRDTGSRTALPSRPGCRPRRWTRPDRSPARTCSSAAGRAGRGAGIGPVRRHAWPSGRRSPARIGTGSQFSCGASGQLQRASYTHEGWYA